MSVSNRFSLSSIEDREDWAKSVAKKILELNSEKEAYTVAAGISPSGVVHFGNFRDVITAYMVKDALISEGKKAKMIFSWDNFDRLRKVPSGVPEAFSVHIGKPLSKVPDPFGEFSSYAERFQAPFVIAMQKLGIDIEYRDQTKMYESGVYDEMIKHAMLNRKEIGEVLVSFMTEKAIGEKKIDIEDYKNNFYPISIYSRFTGKDSTKILKYDDDMTVTYLCLETKKEDVVNLRETHIAKLNWKIDWPMRWAFEGVDFEPGGSDHAAPGGSYDVASVFADKVFKVKPPVFVEYMFVGIHGLGAKMSGSKGNAVSPLDLLDIYTPALLKWLYYRKDPNQTFELAFDSEIYRQYDEFDREHENKKSISFRQMVGLGQILQWQMDKIVEILGELNLDYSVSSVEERMPLAKNWLNKYNQGEIIELRDELNKKYFVELPDSRKENIRKLFVELSADKHKTIADLELLTYHIPKDASLSEVDLKKEQRIFFKDVYNLLITRDTGPRLGTFLWAIDRRKALELLNFN